MKRTGVLLLSLLATFTAAARDRSRSILTAAWDSSMPLSRLPKMSGKSSGAQGAFKVKAKAVRGKRILRVDDLYLLGATASIVAEALIAGGAVSACPYPKRYRADPDARLSRQRAAEIL